MHTSTDKNQEDIHILQNTYAGMRINHLFAHGLGFYVTQLNALISRAHEKSLFKLWHTKLGHPGTNLWPPFTQSLYHFVDQSKLS